MKRFVIGIFVGSALTSFCFYLAVAFSYLPEIYLINHSEERSHPLPFLMQQFYDAMEAQRARLYRALPPPAPTPSLPPLPADEGCL